MGTNESNTLLDVQIMIPEHADGSSKSKEISEDITEVDRIERMPEYYSTSVRASCIDELGELADR